MPAEALKYVTGICDSAGAWRPLCTNWYHRSPFVPSATEKGNGSLARGELASQVPKDWWLLSNHQHLQGNGVSFGPDTHLVVRWRDSREMCSNHV